MCGCDKSRPAFASLFPRAVPLQHTRKIPNTAFASPVMYIVVIMHDHHDHHVVT